MAGYITIAALFIVTAIAEITGTFFTYLWLKKQGTIWLLVPSVAALALFAWLLTLHPNAAGRTYAAYGGTYIAVSLIWLWLVEHEAPTVWDIVGASLCLVGSAIVIVGALRTH